MINAQHNHLTNENNKPPLKNQLKNNFSQILRACNLNDMDFYTQKGCFILFI